MKKLILLTLPFILLLSSCYSDEETKLTSLTGFWIYESDGLFCKVALLEDENGHLTYSGIEGGSAKTLAFNGKGLRVSDFISLFEKLRTISTTVGVIVDDDTIVFDNWKGSNDYKPFVLKRQSGPASEVFFKMLHLYMP